MSDDKNSRGLGGGVHISGGTVTAQNIAGHNVVVSTQTLLSQSHLEEVFHPVMEAVRTTASDKQLEAAQKVEALKSEVSKGKNASDSIMARLVDGIVTLVPGAIGAVASAFGTPILSGVAGPA